MMISIVLRRMLEHSPLRIESLFSQYSLSFRYSLSFVLTVAE